MMHTIPRNFVWACNFVLASSLFGVKCEMFGAQLTATLVCAAVQASVDIVV